MQTERLVRFGTIPVQPVRSPGYPRYRLGLPSLQVAVR